MGHDVGGAAGDVGLPVVVDLAFVAVAPADDAEGGEAGDDDEDVGGVVGVADVGVG